MSKEERPVHYHKDFIEAQKLAHQETQAQSQKQLADSVPEIRATLDAMRAELAQAREEAKIARQEAQTAREDARLSQKRADDHQEEALRLQRSIKNAHWWRVGLAGSALLISVAAFVLSVIALFMKSSNP